MSDKRDETGKDDSARINALQIAAATGAATTAAVVADALGIYGTVVGVAVISVITSVGTVVYLKSMRHTKDKFDKVVKNRDTIVLRSKTGSVTAAVADPPTTDNPAAPTEPVTKATGTAKVPTVVIPDDEPDTTTARGMAFLKRNWRSIAVSSLVVFALTVGLLTSIALLSGKPATSYYDSSPDKTPATQQQTGDEHQPSDDDRPGQDRSPSGDTSTTPGSQEPSSPPATSTEPEPSTQDSSPADDGGGDGDLNPTPSSGDEEASRP